MDTIQKKILRFHLDLDWTVEEMGVLLLYTEELYKISLFLHHARAQESEQNELIRSSFADILHNIEHRVYLARRFQEDSYPLQPLKVVRIQYGSPGLADILGLGEIIGHLKDFFFRIREWKYIKRQREQEIEEKEMKNRLLLLEVQQKESLSLTERRYKELQMELENRQKELTNALAELEYRERIEEAKWKRAKMLEELEVLKVEEKGLEHHIAEGQQMMEIEKQRFRKHLEELRAPKENVLRFLGIRESDLNYQADEFVSRLIALAYTRQLAFHELMKQGKIASISIQDAPNPDQ